MNPPISPLPSPSSGPDPVPAVASVPGPLWLDGLRQAAQARLTWLWHGYLAAGNVTLLTSQWKAGKTTLLSVLLARLKTGGLLAGLPLMAGKAAVVSEESPAHWVGRSQKLDFADHLCWFCRPFPGKPSQEQWLALLDRVAEVHAAHGLSLVAMDPLSAFFPGRGENNAELMLEFLMPLQRLTRLNLAVLLLHHPTKKAQTADGLAARGSGALGGFADILVEMKWHTRGSEDDRRRRLLAFSRYDETPRQLVIELSADGTDYRGLGSFLEEEFAQSWTALRSILQKATDRLARSQVMARWPEDVEAPDPVTVWRWLEQAVSQGLLLREGSGLKADPYRYWLPGQEEQWRYLSPATEAANLIDRLQHCPDAAFPFEPNPSATADPGPRRKRR